LDVPGEKNGSRQGYCKGGKKRGVHRKGVSATHVREGMRTGGKDRIRSVKVCQGNVRPTKKADNVLESVGSEVLGPKR